MAHKTFAAGYAAGRHPFVFLRYLAKQTVAFEPIRAAGGLEARIAAALEEQLRPFMTAPPATLLQARTLEEISSSEATLEVVSLRAGDSSELPPAEIEAVTRLASLLRPGVVFEIGTYRGRTTRLLAACSPSATVHTLDLPPDQMLEGGCFREPDPHLIGLDFGSDGRRIVQHYGDSRLFDFTPFRGGVDLVFVDASHAYEAVLNDSKRAFDMLRDGGAVLWDDYHPIHGPGVMRALAEIGVQKRLSWIRGTRLAIHISNGG